MAVEVLSVGFMGPAETGVAFCIETTIAGETVAGKRFELASKV